MSTKRKTRDAVEIVDHIYGGDAEWDRMVAQEEMKARVAEIVYNLREQAGLTQAQLARRIGVTQSMISKLENADYDGAFLDVLLRVCLSLDRRLVVSCDTGSYAHSR